MNPTITITNINTTDEVPRVIYTVTIPRNSGVSILHGRAELDEPIEIPIVEDDYQSA